MGSWKYQELGRVTHGDTANEKRSQVSDPSLTDPRAHMCISSLYFFFFFPYNHLVIRHLLDVDFGCGLLFGETEDTNKTTVLALRYWHFIWGNFCCWMKTMLISKQKEGSVWNMKVEYHTSGISTVCFQRPTCLRMSPSHSSAPALFTNSLLALCLSLIPLASVCPQGNH